MADDLPIKITLDPTAAAQGAKKVVDELAKTEEAAKRSQQAYSALGETFKKIAENEARMAKEAAQARQAVDNLSGSFKGLGQAIDAQALTNTAKQFDSLTQAIRREQEVLERIHGPAKRYADDLQVLDSLLARNKISTREYADQVSRLNQQTSKSQLGETRIARGADILGGAPSASDNRLASISAGIGSLNFKQAASGANQAFELLNQKLHIVNDSLGSAIGSAVKFGATGAQIAGPWGAAVGAVVGITADLVSKFIDAEAETKKLREEQEKLAKEYWDGVHAAEQKKRIEDELAPALAEHARLAKEVAEREQTASSVMNAQADEYRHATDRAQAYADQLYKVNAELAIKMQLEAEDRRQKGTGQTDDQNKQIIDARGLRDATIAKENANKSYGATLNELESAENKRNDRLRDLEQILADQQASAGAQKRALEEYNKLIHEQTDAQKAAAAAAKQHAQEIENLRKQLFGGATFKPESNNAQFAIEQAQREADIRTLNAQQEAIRNEALGRRDKRMDYLTDEQINASAQGVKLPDTIKETNEQLELMKSAAQSAGTQLVEMFAKGDFSAQSFKSVLESIALQLATGFVSQRIGAAFPSGLPGHATGAYYPPSGSGTTDSQFVAFRKSPWESVYVNTPGQDANMRQSGGGLRVVQVSADPRALAPAVGGGDDTVLLQWASKNRDKLRRILD